jgi:hypothetical protein
MALFSIGGITPENKSIIKEFHKKFIDYKLIEKKEMNREKDIKLIKENMEDLACSSFSNNSKNISFATVWTHFFPFPVISFSNSFNNYSRTLKI